VTILLLSQLSRRYADRKDPRPLMSDLRGSGAIEQDADLILFPFRPGVFDDQVCSSKAEIHVAKNRHGDTGRINGHSGIDELRWDGSTQRFLTLDEYTSITQRRRGR
jgi:replicative DNA helicase